MLRTAILGTARSTGGLYVQTSGYDIDRKLLNRFVDGFERIRARSRSARHQCGASREAPSRPCAIVLQRRLEAGTGSTRGASGESGSSCESEFGTQVVRARE